jgi:hypothetical protein
MRSAGPLVLVLSFSLAACGGGGGDPDGRVISVDAPGAIDARVDAALPTPDADLGLACLGDPGPSGTGRVPLAGRVFGVVDYDAQPFAGATVELHARADGALLDSTESAADGGFAFTTTAPVDVYFVVTADGMVPTYAYADDLAAEQDDLLFIVDTAELTRWYADAGTTYAAGARTIVALLRDCILDPALGATLDTSPSASVIYYDEPAMRWDPTLSSGDNGFALIPNAPASLTATPHYHAATFPPETIESLPSTVTMTIITPHS